jgi:hypothetical protein
LFDDHDMGEIHSPDYPGERLIVCRNRDLAAERARKRAALLAAGEKELAAIAAAVTGLINLTARHAALNAQGNRRGTWSVRPVVCTRSRRPLRGKD